MADLRDIEAEERALVSYALHNMEVYTFTRSKLSYESALERAEILRREAERLRRQERDVAKSDELSTS